MNIEILTVFIENVWEITMSLSLWLLLGLGIAGLLHVCVPDNFIQHHLGHRKGLFSVFKAVMLGVPMPLCSCGVIPTALGIKKQGAGDGAAIGFLISTPQTGVDSIMVSASMLGFPFAIFKLISAFVIGIIGGGWAYFTNNTEDVEKIIDVDSSGKKKKKLRDFFNFAIDDLLKMIWKWIIAGIILSAAISTWLPKDFFQTYLPDNLFIAMLIVLVISLPMYVCATASVPIAAALVAAGMPVGAALVFLMAGPASNIATVGAVFRAFGWKKLVIYLVSITVGSMLCGYLFQFVMPPSSATSSVMKHGEHGVVEWFSGIVLLLLMLRFLLLDIKHFFSGIKSNRGSQVSEIIKISVGGVTCATCATKLSKGLMSLEGVSEINVDIDNRKVFVAGNHLNRKILDAQILSMGFTLL